MKNIYNINSPLFRLHHQQKTKSPKEKQSNKIFIAASLPLFDGHLSFLSFMYKIFIFIHLSLFLLLNYPRKIGEEI